MNIEEIAGIIEKSSKELDLEDLSEAKMLRKFAIKVAGQLLNVQLDELEHIIMEIGELEFGSGENEVFIPDRKDVYEKINSADKNLNPVRKLTESKMYLEARNTGLIAKAESK